MSVQNEMKRLKRRVRKAQAAPDPLAILEYQAAVCDRLYRSVVLHEDVSNYPMPPCPWPEGYATGARERFAERLLAIADRRERAEQREKRRALERDGDRAAFDEAIQERMQKIDEETKGEATRAPFVPMVSEKGNPIAEILRRRLSQGGAGDEAEEKEEHERSED